MKKIKLLITSAALLVGGSLLAYSSNNMVKANAAIVGSENTPKLTQVTDMNSFKSGDYVIGNLDEDNFIGDYNSSKYDFVRSSDARLLTFTEVSSDDSGTYFTIFDTEENFFLGYGSKTNFNKLTAVKDDSGYWYVDIGSDGKVKIISKKDDTRAILYRNGSSASEKKFAPYAVSNVEDSSGYTYPYVYYLPKESIEVTLHYGDDITNTYSVDSGITLQRLIELNSITFEKENYTFEGWYTDSEFLNLFDPLTPITNNVELYAKYIELTEENYFESLSTQTSIKATSETVIDKKTFSVDLVGISSSGNKLFSDSDFVNQLSDVMFGNDSEDWKVSFEKKSSHAPGFYKSGSNLRLYENDSLTFSNINGISSITLTETNDGGFDILNNEGQVLYSETGKITNKTYNFDECKSIIIKANGSIRISKLEFETYGNVISPKEVSLRFGANIPLDHYVSTDVSYGVIIADGAKIAKGADLNKLYNGSTTAADYVTYLKQQNISAYQAAFTSDEIAYVATPNSTVDLDETDPTAKYAQFALVIDDLLEHMDRTFAAVCYMEYEGQLYLMKETRHSINSVVDAYLADEEIMGTLTDNSVAILNALNAM